MGAQVLHAHVAAELDAAEEAEARVRGHLVEDRCHGLDLLMVGRDAGAHQSVRRRHPIIHVHLCYEAWLAEQLVGGIEPGGPGADDGDAQRLSFGAGSGHLPVGLPCSSVSSIWRFSTSPR